MFKAMWGYSNLFISSNPWLKVNYVQDEEKRSLENFYSDSHGTAMNYIIAFKWLRLLAASFSTGSF
jgi:hypothetical protein